MEIQENSDLHCTSLATYLGEPIRARVQQELDKVLLVLTIYYYSSYIFIAPEGAELESPRIRMRTTKVNPGYGNVFPSALFEKEWPCL